MDFESGCRNNRNEMNVMDVIVVFIKEIFRYDWEWGYFLNNLKLLDINR